MVADNLLFYEISIIKDILLLTMMIVSFTLITSNDNDGDNDDDSGDNYDNDDRCEKEKSGLKEGAFENLENQSLHNHDAAQCP